MKEEEDLGQQADKYEKWLTEDFLLDEIERTPDEQMRLERLYDYLQLIKEYDEELGLDE